jgi:hypothetical protein
MAEGTERPAHLFVFVPTPVLPHKHLLRAHLHSSVYQGKMLRVDRRLFQR